MKAMLRNAPAVLLAVLALAFALVGRMILEHLTDHPDSPVVNVVLTAIVPLAVAALLLNAALAALSRCGTSTRWIAVLLTVAAVVPYDWLAGRAGVLLNIAFGLAAAVVLSRARRARRATTRT